MSLFGSLSTLVCCALPILLVAIGMGTSLIFLLSIFPWLKVVSDYKVYLFIGAGLILLLAYNIHWQDRNLKCPADKKLKEICSKSKLMNFKILNISLVIYLVGFFFAFLADDIFF